MTHHRLALALALCMPSFGCGAAMWGITPRPEVTYQEVSRTSLLDVTTSPAGATLYVDGAEAGLTPRRVPIAHKELRRQRRQGIVLPVIGTLVDLVLCSVLTAVTGDESGPGPGLLVASIGVGIVGLDLYLITGRSVVNEGVDHLPVATEIGARIPGFHDVARRVRVPDLERVHFTLVPASQAPSPDERAPMPFAPPSMVPPTELLP